MAPLNQYEQDRIAEFEALQARRRRGEYVNDAALERAREIAGNMERNAEAREERLAQLQAEEDAQAAARQAKRDAAALAAQEAYKRVARSTFPGTQAQFDAAWPRLLEEWQIRNTASDQDALIEHARSRVVF